jgi:hypothetical protein
LGAFHFQTRFHQASEQHFLCGKLHVNICEYVSATTSGTKIFGYCTPLQDRNYSKVAKANQSMYVEILFGS